MKNKILILALGAVSVLAIVNQADNTAPQVGQVQIQPTKVARGSGNSKKYIAKFRQTDGGHTYRTVATPGCVRRKAGAPVAACRRNHPELGLIDQGQLNRFPQSEAQGGQCQAVSCSLFLGQPSDLNDDQLLDAGY